VQTDSFGFHNSPAAQSPNPMAHHSLRMTVAFAVQSFLPICQGGRRPGAGLLAARAREDSRLNKIREVV